LTCPKDGGAEARAIPAPAQQNPATYVRTTTRAAAARPRPAVANRPGGHDRRSTRPAAWLALPARDGFPAELAVTIQDGTAFVIASLNPTRTAAAEPNGRAGRENTAATRITPRLSDLRG
jgi:hypothetical protein